MRDRESHASPSFIPPQNKAKHAALVNPDRVVICDGSQREWRELSGELVMSGGLHKLETPDSFLARSPPSDVARVEENTFICCTRKEDAGPLNNWVHPEEMRSKLLSLFKDSARGRTLYAIFMRFGPPMSAGSKLALQLTDSAYVVLSSHIMSVVAPLNELELTVPVPTSVIPLFHSLGCPLLPNDADVPWPHSSNVVIAHFPETKDVYSIGSGYGGNALLGKKCLSLRLGSVIGREEGWFAEHMVRAEAYVPSGWCSFT